MNPEHSIGACVTSLFMSVLGDPCQPDGIDIDALLWGWKNTLRAKEKSNAHVDMMIRNPRARVSLAIKLLLAMAQNLNTANDEHQAQVPAEDQRVQRLEIHTAGDLVGRGGGASEDPGPQAHAD